MWGLGPLDPQVFQQIFIPDIQDSLDIRDENSGYMCSDLDDMTLSQGHDLPFGHCEISRSNRTEKIEDPDTDLSMRAL